MRQRIRYLGIALCILVFGLLSFGPDDDAFTGRSLVFILLADVAIVYLFDARLNTHQLVLWSMEKLGGPLRKNGKIIYRLSPQRKTRLHKIAINSGLALIIGIVFASIGTSLMVALRGIGLFLVSWLGFAIWRSSNIPIEANAEVMRPLYHEKPDGRQVPINSLAVMELICLNYIRKDEFSRVYYRDVVGRDAKLATMLEGFPRYYKPWAISQNRMEEWLFLSLASILLRNRKLKGKPLREALSNVWQETQKDKMHNADKVFMLMALQHDAQGETRLKELLLETAEIKKEIIF